MLDICFDVYLKIVQLCLSKKLLKRSQSSRHYFRLALNDCGLFLVFCSLLIFFLFALVRVRKKNPLGGKTRAEAPFESLAGQHVFVGALPVKMQERGSQQTGCLLFTVVQIDSVRLAFEAHDPGGLFSAVPSLSPTLKALRLEPLRAHKHAQP